MSNLTESVATQIRHKPQFRVKCATHVVAAEVESMLWEQGVAGSNPVVPTIHLPDFTSKTPEEYARVCDPSFPRFHSIYLVLPEVLTQTRHKLRRAALSWAGAKNTAPIPYLPTSIDQLSTRLEHRSPTADPRPHSHINGVPGWGAMASRTEGGSARGIGEMATVIEPGVVGSAAIRRVASLLGVEDDLVLGKVVRLWDGSQSAEKAKASEEEIAFWIGVERGELAERWVSALSDPLAGFLKRDKKGAILIAGNSRHIRKIRALKKAAKNGGEANRKKWAARKAQPKPTLDAEPNGYPTGEPGGMPNGSSKRAQAKPGQAKLDISAEHLVEATEEWAKTLKHFGIEREITAHDQTQIARAIQGFGIETAKLAIRGARFEPSSETFRPKDHLSLARIFGRDKQGNLRVEKFVNLGAQNKPQKRETHRPEVGPC